MSFIYDPPTSDKIKNIKKCLCWNHPTIIDQGIEQTELVLDDGKNDLAEFSFLVLGDTDSATEYGRDLQGKIAQELLSHIDTCSFTLHTGDLVYPFGSSELYKDNFMQLYRNVFGNNGRFQKTDDNQIIFNQAFFPIPGNHDYYDLTFLPRLIAQLSLPLRRWLKSQFGLTIGWDSSYQGKAYAQTFLDCLSQQKLQRDLASYLQQHYSAETKSGKCLRYQPGKFTRLPNRYYTFRYGGIDFFALDSNTFCYANSSSKDNSDPDLEQLNWLQEKLIDSWHNPKVRGRIIYLHHSPYSTEASRYQQPESIIVRRHLRQVFSQVARAINYSSEKRPLVDLILSGHSHCFEYLHTLDTGYADSHLNWLVCGGSGADLRSQSKEGGDLMEISSGGYVQMVARSSMFFGRTGRSKKRGFSHSFLRIDVHKGVPPRFVIRPFLVEHIQNKWISSAVKPFVLKGI